MASSDEVVLCDLKCTSVGESKRKDLFQTITPAIELRKTEYADK